MKLILTGDEYNVLNRIAAKTKMDCWFHLDVDASGSDCVRDLEYNSLLPLREGVATLNDGIVPELLNLTDGEIEVYANLLKELGIQYNPFEN